MDLYLGFLDVLDISRCHTTHNTTSPFFQELLFTCMLTFTFSILANYNHTLYEIYIYIQDYKLKYYFILFYSKNYLS